LDTIHNLQKIEIGKIMPQIVQFTHPGAEHRPDKTGGNHKSNAATKENSINRRRTHSRNECRKGELVFGASGCRVTLEQSGNQTT
jgi:hypothetical protein